GRLGDAQLAHPLGGDAHGLANPLGALDEEGPRAPAGRGRGRRTPGQRPNRRDPLGAGVGQLRCHPGVARTASQAETGALTSCGRAAFATPTSVANAAGSLTARSASTRRSTVTSAALRPWMKRLYVRPSARAAALMRWIHSLRKSPLRALRSR